ncbi:unnamed protein product [Soboliphyme baturini]|uniref:Protein Shroom1 n=1 Tax=Soboliphyme baturini TaxID=241478 RepID=A0A183IJI9_9BILA|nr:unnamed protein product [Soboliphyme baturini]
MLCNVSSKRLEDRISQATPTQSERLSVQAFPWSSSGPIADLSGKWSPLSGSSFRPLRPTAPGYSLPSYTLTTGGQRICGSSPGVQYIDGLHLGSPLLLPVCLVDSLSPVPRFAQLPVWLPVLEELVHRATEEPSTAACLPLGCAAASASERQPNTKGELRSKATCQTTPSGVAVCPRRADSRIRNHSCLQRSGCSSASSFSSSDTLSGHESDMASEFFVPHPVDDYLKTVSADEPLAKQARYSVDVGHGKFRSLLPSVFSVRVVVMITTNS